MGRDVGTEQSSNLVPNSASNLAVGSEKYLEAVLVFSEVSTVVVSEVSAKLQRSFGKVLAQFQRGFGEASEATPLPFSSHP